MMWLLVFGIRLLTYDIADRVPLAIKNVKHVLADGYSLVLAKVILKYLAM